MDNDRTNEARELTEAELDAVSGGLQVTKLMDSSSPLLMQESLVGKATEAQIN